MPWILLTFTWSYFCFFFCVNIDDIFYPKGSVINSNLCRIKDSQSLLDCNPSFTKIFPTEHCLNKQRLISIHQLDLSFWGDFDLAINLGIVVSISRRFSVGNPSSLAAAAKGHRANNQEDKRPVKNVLSHSAFRFGDLRVFVPKVPDRWNESFGVWFPVGSERIRNPRSGLLWLAKQ